MKTIIKALGTISTLTIIITMLYFLGLYGNFTQLILVLTIAGAIINISFLFLYDWMMNKDKELEDMDKTIDLTRDYMVEHVEGKGGTHDINRIKIALAELDKKK